MNDETKDKLYEREVEFVETESRFINGGLSHTKEVAQAMAQDHRYLVQERFKLTLEYWKTLAKNYHRAGMTPGMSGHVRWQASLSNRYTRAGSYISLMTSKRN